MFCLPRQFNPRNRRISAQNKKPTSQFNLWRWVTWIRQFC
jgi:hypothetical protein